jgi:regulator of sigma E protease
LNVTYSPAGALVGPSAKPGHRPAAGQFITFRGRPQDKYQLGGPVRIADMAGKPARLVFRGWCNSSRCCRSDHMLNLLPFTLGGVCLLPRSKRPPSGANISWKWSTGSLHGGPGVHGFVFWNDLWC